MRTPIIKITMRLGGDPVVQRFWAKGLIVARMVLWALGCATVMPPVSAATESNHWQGVAIEIAAALDTAMAGYAQGDAEAARRAVTRAYFGVFEGSKMEAAMRTERGAKQTYLVERQFGVLRKAIKNGIGVEELQRTVDALTKALHEAAKDLDRARIAPEVFVTGE